MRCLKLLAAAALLFTATTASAQLYLYAGAGGGNPKFDGNDFPLLLTRRDDTKDVTYHVGLGYRFNPHWAVEIGAADLGDYSHDGQDFFGNTLRGTYKVAGFKTAVLGIVPLTERLSLFGKLGIGSTKAEFEGTLSVGGTATTFTVDERRNSLLAGFGAQYMIWPNLGVRGEFENWGEVGNEKLFPGDTSHTGRAKMATWNLQAVFTF
jgi:opacity protein-like surface antigen